MTIDEFKRTAWSPGMTATYHRDGERYEIIECDFGESLVALYGVTPGSDDPNWVRCENITLVDA